MTLERRGAASSSARTFETSAPRSLLRSFLLALGCLLLSSQLQAADVSGKWSASSLRVSWAIGDWGKACGPRPSGGGEKGGIVTLTPKGSDFHLSGLGRSYSTSQCWERMPDLTPRSHTAGSSAIRTVCKMPAGDPRQATVTTTWYPRGDEIYFDETGQYQFVVEGSNCTASVRRTRLLTRVVEKPEEPPSPSSAQPKPATEPAPSPQSRPQPTAVPSAERPPSPERASRCAQAGSAVHLEVSPKTKLMRLGETFSFEAVARDERGCRASVNTRWALLTPGSARLTKDGVLTIPENAAPGLVRLEARVGDQAVEVTARVVSDAEYEELIAGGAYGVMGESQETATITLSSSHVEFDEQEEGGTDRKLLALVGVLLALLIGAVVFLVLHRSRTSHARKSLPEELREEKTPTVPPPPQPSTEKPVAPPTPAHPVRLCPVCGKRYEDGTMFCVEDGARLVRSN